MAKAGSITNRRYYLSMFFLLATILFGTAFIVLSQDARFFKWKVENCVADGPAPLTGPGNFIFNLDMEVDIGWRMFKVLSLDEGADEIGRCFGDFRVGETYPLGDFEDNSGAWAGYGMVGSWALGVLVALYTLIALCRARNGNRTGGVALTTLYKLCCLFTVGVVAATTVFWWLVEGKFGRRQESLAPRLFELIREGADGCSNALEDLCREAEWNMDAPGWALSLGITAMFAFAAACVLLSLIVARVDHLNSGEEELEAVEPVKPAVGSTVVAEKPEEKARAKDRRSAKTGVRAAPSSTVHGDAADSGPDPMTYALQQGHDEELGSSVGDEEEVVYQNHQVHHAVINHSNANPTQQVDDSRNYTRGYQSGASGNYASGGGRSFDEGQSDFSEASSAQYYAQGQGAGGRSFMSGSSRGDSYDEYR